MPNLSELCLTLLTCGEKPEEHGQVTHPTTGEQTWTHSTCISQEGAHPAAQRSVEISNCWAPGLPLSAPSSVLQLSEEEFGHQACVWHEELTRTLLLLAGTAGTSYKIVFVPAILIKDLENKHLEQQGTGSF